MQPLQEPSPACLKLAVARSASLCLFQPVALLCLFLVGPVQVWAVTHQLTVMLLGHSLMTSVIHAIAAPQVQQVVAAAHGHLIADCERDQLQCHNL